MKKNKIKKRIVVAMSGGVDSSVAAKILYDQGYDVIGIFMIFWKEKESTKENKCCSNVALKDARKVAKKIGFPLYVINLSNEFKREVVDYFLKEYKAGNTPNPCVVCNKKIKLGLLIKKAEELGFDYIATGHYARLRREFSKNTNKKLTYKLYKAKDKNKDQSYFLYTLSQNELKSLIFPLSDYTKPQVRALAKKFKLPVAEKKESQEICFISEKSHNEFLKRHLKFKPGPIIHYTRNKKRGKMIGKHKGLPLYTIGQRKGIELGGAKPYYVSDKDLAKNILYVTDRQNGSELNSDQFYIKNINWLSGNKPRLPYACEVVIRYHHKPVKCIIKKDKGGNIKIYLNEPQRAITAGQSAVFYQGNEVLGGGIIVK